MFLAIGFCLVTPKRVFLPLSISLLIAHIDDSEEGITTNFYYFANSPCYILRRGSFDLYYSFGYKPYYILRRGIFIDLIKILFARFMC